MNRMASVMSAVVVLAAVAAGGPVAAAETYGEGVSLADATPIGDIVADPDAWAGKEVRIEGRVTDVCAKKGCWMELEGADAARLRIKVEDDVIVFPQDATGRQASAQGKVEILDLEREAYVGWMRHEAEEKGESFDEAEVGDGPYRIVRIRGTGAEITAE